MKKLVLLFTSLFAMNLMGEVREEEYSQKQLYSISRASQFMDRNAIWEGAAADFNVQFGSEHVSWIVVVVPTSYSRRGRVDCGIASVRAFASGLAYYPKFVGQLPAKGGVQAYYRLNKGDGRSIDKIRVAIYGNRLVHDNCPVNVYVVRGAFQPHSGDSEE